MKFKNINSNKYIVHDAIPAIEELMTIVGNINKDKPFLNVLTDNIVNKMVCRAVAESFIATHTEALNKNDFVTITIPERNNLLISVGKTMLDEKIVYLDGVLET